jgi:hypothetical protein
VRAQRAASERRGCGSRLAPVGKQITGLNDGGNGTLSSNYNPDDGDSMLNRNLLCIHKTTQRHNPHLNSHRREKIEFFIEF